MNSPSLDTLYAQVEALLNNLRAMKEKDKPAPIDPLAEVKAAHAAGKVIQWRSDYGGEWKDCEKDDPPLWYSVFQYRIKPWSLPDPPQGREWHRVDWLESMLPDGYRPLLNGEAIQLGDYWSYERDKQDFSEWTDNRSLPTLRNCFYRTTRPLPPLPDPERERFPLEANDVPPGSYVRDREAAGVWCAVLAVSNSGVYVLTTQRGAELRTFDRIKELGFEILRPGNTEWQPCSKEVEE